MYLDPPFLFFFFFHTWTTEIYTLSLHDALPISCPERQSARARPSAIRCLRPPRAGDRKSTRLNSSHEWISYAVFCLKKKGPRAHETFPGSAQCNHKSQLLQFRSKSDLQSNNK